jgi:hypothetical protein
MMQLATNNVSTLLLLFHREGQGSPEGLDFVDLSPAALSSKAVGAQLKELVGNMKISLQCKMGRTSFTKAIDNDSLVTKVVEVGKSSNKLETCQKNFPMLSPTDRRWGSHQERARNNCHLNSI